MAYGNDQHCGRLREQIYDPYNTTKFSSDAHPQSNSGDGHKQNHPASKSKYNRKRNAKSKSNSEEKDGLSPQLKNTNEKQQHRAQEISSQIQEFIGEIEHAAEEDAKLNRQSKPAITKLQMLSTLTRVLTKKQFQSEFLDRGLLCALKKWLDPLPNGCLPHSHIRNAVLKVLQDLPIDIKMPERKQQLIDSSLGHVIMFMSKSDEETLENKRIAEELVSKWSGNWSPDDGDACSTGRHLLSNFLSQEDQHLLRNYGRELAGGSRKHRAMGFKVRPESKIDPHVARQVRAQTSFNEGQDGRRWRMEQRMMRLRAPNKKKIGAF